MAKRLRVKAKVDLNFARLHKSSCVTCTAKDCEGCIRWRHYEADPRRMKR